jgi:hypothetical protein
LPYCGPRWKWSGLRKRNIERSVDLIIESEILALGSDLETKLRAFEAERMEHMGSKPKNTLRFLGHDVILRIESSDSNVTRRIGLSVGIRPTFVFDEILESKIDHSCAD